MARTTTYHATDMIRFLESAISHRGFSVVEILSQCPTYFGRENRRGSAVDMILYYKEHATPLDRGKPPAGGFAVGVFVDEDRPEYCHQYEAMVAKACGGDEG